MLSVTARLNIPWATIPGPNRPVRHRINDETLVVAERDYKRLSMETAQRTIRFWQLQPGW